MKLFDFTVRARKILLCAVAAVFLFVCFCAASAAADLEGTTEEGTTGAPEEVVIPIISFELDRRSAVELLSDGVAKTFYLRSLTVDMNRDGKTNAVDARIMLRAAAKLFDLPVEDSVLDLDGDGLFNAADARICLLKAAGLYNGYVSEDGETPKGFRETVSGGQMFFTDAGALFRGMLEKDGLRRYFDADGLLREGIIDHAGRKYFILKNGNKHTGLVGREGLLLYSKDGVIQTGIVDDGGLYCFGEDYERVYGVVSSGGRTYNFMPDGSYYTGFAEKDGVRYHFTNGVSRHGMFEEDGHLYRSNPDGTLFTGWLEENGKTYHFLPSGVAVTGYTNIDDVNYYFREDGSMLRGLVYVNGRQRYFRDDGSENLAFPDNIPGFTYYSYKYTLTDKTRVAYIDEIVRCQQSPRVTLKAHENDDYYLNTPSAGSDSGPLPISSPYGNPNPGYAPGFNCAGFVASVYRDSGADLSVIVNASEYGKRIKNQYASGEAWHYCAENTGAVIYRFDSIEQALASGLMHQGDLIFFEPKSWTKPDVYGHFIDDHIGIYWGDGSSDVFWDNSAWTVWTKVLYAGRHHGNHITNIHPGCVSTMFVFPISRDN